MVSQQIEVKGGSLASARALPFPHYSGPLPKSVGHFWRKPMAELASNHNDLAAMVVDKLKLADDPE